MENLNLIIAKNLSKLRKEHKLTQVELAEQLNYSDKAVSKWEQGESMPSIEVLYKLSRIYGVSLDYLVGEEKSPKKIPLPIKKNRNVITLLSVLAVWFVAVFLYIIMDLFAGIKLWPLFCWAVPTSFIVAIIFDVVWHKSRFFFLIVSLLLWTTLLCFCLQFLSYNIWTILGIGAPLQIGVLLWKWLVK